MTTGRLLVAAAVALLTMGPGLMRSADADAYSRTQDDRSNGSATKDRSKRKVFRGVWEGFTTDPLKYFLIEIGPVRHKWRVVMVASETYLFGVNSVKVFENRLEIVCSGREAAMDLALRIVGRGWSSGDEDKLHTRMTLTDAMGRITHGSWRVDLLSCKGGCVEELVSMKALAEKAMAGAQTEGKDNQ
jgi:hypothetical protein